MEKGAPAKHARVAGLHITDRPSERLKPFQHGGVGAPRGRPGSGAGGGASLRERLPLHVEVDGGVPVRGRDTGVAEPLADRDDVDAGPEQVDGSAVPHAVGMEALAAQGRQRGLRTGAVLLQQVADAESAQPGSAVIAEDRLVGLQLASAFGQQGTQQVGGLGPQRADAFLPPLAVEADLCRCVQPHVGDAQGDDFLDPRPGVEHGGEERVVAAAVDGVAIDGAEDNLDLFMLEVLHGAAAGPLERDGEDALTVREPCGVLHGAVPECMDRGEAHVAGGGAVVPVELQVLKEREDRLGAEVVSVELDDGPLRLGRDEAQQEHEAVSIAPDGVGARPPHPGQVVGEERPEGSRQVIGNGGGHRTSPAVVGSVVGPVTRSPQWSANLELAAAARGSMNWR